MRRRTVHPFGQATPTMRLVSMVTALLVLWMLYGRLKDPATWTFLVDEHPIASANAQADPSAEATMESEAEEIVAGPNDLDESEAMAIRELFELVTDRSPLKSREMDAYWRLMDWSRTQSFDQLERRARQDVAFTRLWEQPEMYRGEPICLRLHVRRVLQYDAPGNPSGINKVCEAWGWTDESRSFPYVVVFPGTLPGLPIGTDVRAEIHFTGYFLKIMTYSAFDHTRGAPLLIGRAKVVSTPAISVAAKPDTSSLMAFVAGAILLVIVAVWTGARFRVSTRRKHLPDQLESLGASVPFLVDASASSGDTDQPVVDDEMPFTFGCLSEDKSPPSSPA